jgi:hypothetical protein
VFEKPLRRVHFFGTGSKIASLCICGIADTMRENPNVPSTVLISRINRQPLYRSAQFNPRQTSVDSKQKAIRVKIG